MASTKSRLNNINKKQSHLDIRTRHKELIKLEGWYKVIFSIEDVILPEHIQSYKNSGSSMKITRWLLRKGIINKAQASEYGKQLNNKIDFKLSCRYNDLLRLAETKHYKSCFSGNLGKQQLHFLSDPDVALLYVPDKSGKYLWRRLVRLMMEDKPPYNYCLFVYKAYGNSNDRLILQTMNKVIPLFEDYTHFSQHKSKLVSVTKYNNPISFKPFWSDHTFLVKKSKLTILANEII